jgi:ATP-dependent Clp protease protease subunit
MPTPNAPEETNAPKKEEVSLTERLLNTRTLTLFETVTSKVAKEIVQGLFLLEAYDDAKPINLFINSPGGEVTSGFAIYDAIRFIKPEVRVIATGLCASIATIITVAVKKENRLSLPNCRFLIHQPSISGIAGSTADIEITAREIMKTKAYLNQILSKETGQTLARVEQDMDRDYWMTANEAKEYGLVTRIIQSKADLK